MKSGQVMTLTAELTYCFITYLLLPLFKVPPEQQNQKFRIHKLSEIKLSLRQKSILAHNYRNLSKVPYRLGKRLTLRRSPAKPKLHQTQNEQIAFTNTPLGLPKL